MTSGEVLRYRKGLFFIFADYESGHSGSSRFSLTAPIVVPSFSSLEDSDHLWWLDCGDASSFTASFGEQSGQYAHFEGIEGVRARPDYFTTSQVISNAQLHLLVDTAKPPREYLVTVSVRPIRAKIKDTSTADTSMLDIPAKSPMSAKNWDFGTRICSATCVSMAMDYLGVDHGLHELVIAAYHRPADRYGVWPQNLWAAGRWGVVGAIETTTDWEVLERAVAEERPFVPLIAFDEGELEGSPIPASLGHMVIVRGIRNNRVVVHDPVANDLISVPRHYDSNEFRKAWLGAMGSSTCSPSPHRIADPVRRPDGSSGLFQICSRIRGFTPAFRIFVRR